jgi:type II secretory pathway pseudopilin PulG
MPNSSTHRRARGFSLVELMVVAAMTGFLLMMMSGMWRAFGRSLMETSDQARLLSEADLAVETLRRDFCGYLPDSDSGPLPAGKLLTRLVVAGGTRLLLCFDGPPADGVANWTAPDVVVSYLVQDGQLVRVDYQAGSVFVVADGVEQFSVVEQAGGVSIQLTIRRRDLSRTYNFVVVDP